ncbi:hypothetical protein [Bacteroides sp.]|uniref:phage portal protein family protein n=1 Tax=Bacteroides sp. TaxID=29523 RepID=UPI00262CE916|nr:hypothetical protein [Bacteroides sp.]MDD3040712.1 hypothetical protein [Bacteroides sp.]
MTLITKLKSFITKSDPIISPAKHPDPGYYPGDFSDYAPGYTVDQILPVGTRFPQSSQNNMSSDYYLNITQIKHAVPEEGWDAFCEWVSKIGKIARIIRTESQNCMSFKLISSKKDDDFEIKQFRRNLQYKKFCQDIAKYLRIYGRCFIQVTWNENESEGIESITHLYPRSIKVYRNHQKDYDDLKNILNEKSTKYTSLTPFATIQPDGSGDIIAFVQTIWIGPEKKHIVFAPDELLFIPRNPSFTDPNGISLIQENYLQIVRKLKNEHSAGIMIERHGDPPMVVTVPEKWWNKRNAIKHELKFGIKEGMNIIFPSGTEHKVSDTRGSPEGVIKSQNYLEKEFTAGMGFADSFTDSENSNRSIGDLHLIFYERDLVGERELVSDILDKHILEPHFKAIGYPGIVTMEFEDLTPPDEGYLAYVLAPLVPYLSKTQIQKYFANIGMAPSEDEMDDLCKRLYDSVKPDYSKSQKEPPKRPIKE